MLPITIAAAFVPSVLLMWYFHSRDVYPEPPRVLWATFGLGVLIVIPVLIVALPTIFVIGNLANPYLKGFASAFLSAAIPEEFFKFLVLWLYCARHREFNEPMDGIVYGVAGSLGFATLENVLYVAKGGLVLALLRALTAVPGHAFLGAIMGYYVGRARFEPERRGALVLAALAVPIALHGLYDFPLLAMAAQAEAWGGNVPSDATPIVLGCVLLAIVTLIVEAVWAVLAARRLRKLQHAAPPPVPGLATAPALSYAGPPAGTNPALGWFLVLGGGVLAAGGGFIALAMALAAILSTDPGLLPALSCVTVVFGVVPLVAGAGLFWWGIRTLNRADAGRAT